MYTCGPSVYRQPHIGNYRTFLFEDVLQRYLEYSGYNVVRLTTLTDIEDKAIAEAVEAKVSVRELTQENIDTFFEEAKLLRMKTPSYVPRSSTTVDQAAKLIRVLLDKGYAYRHTHEGRQNVYFDPLKFKDFGKLSHLDMSKWPKRKRRFHRDTYPGTPWNRGDFVLWHGYKEGDTVSWDTDVGKGRPAWNVQDAAMVTKHLGFTIDIACGGVDNLVRHHDYTIAVAEGASGKEFAHWWLHGEHLFVEGQKMSKSRGNVHYIADLTKMGYRGRHIRFFLLYGHYGERLNFTFDKLRKTSQKLDFFQNLVDNLMKTKLAESSKKAQELVDRLVNCFEENMDNDLDVKGAFDDLFEILSELDNLRIRGKLSSKDAHTAVTNIQKIDSVLQIIF
jgi:cysteinyl-tRNA synthetase